MRTHHNNRTHYNLIAGQSLERLAALSDGIFAVAMTLLVLDLHVPVSNAINSERGLWSALIILAPRLLTYSMSFLTLGIFWTGQQTQLNHFVRSDRNLTWIHLGFLLAVTLTPFSTGLLASFITYRIALVVYWLNILLLGIALFCGLRYAGLAGLVKDETVVEAREHRVPTFLERRIIIAQALYAFAVLLCIINTYVSIVIIVLVQLNYAIAPRIRPLDRL